MAANREQVEVPIPALESFGSKEIRRGFIRKVFSLVTAQLTVAIAFVLITTMVDSVREYLTKADNSDVVVGALVASVVTYIVTAIMVYCISKLSRRFPVNYFLLFILTVSSALIVSIICSAFKVEAVIIALGITTLCCIGVFIFSFNNKFDLGSWQGALFCFFWGILCTSALIPVPYSSITGKIIAGVVAMVFMLILVADIHRIINGDDVSPEEYVLAALQIYSDIVIFFLIILLIVVLIAGEKGNGGGGCGGCDGDCGGCDGSDCGSCGGCGGSGGGTQVERGNNSDACCFICCVRGGEVTRRTSREEREEVDAVHMEQPSKISELEPYGQEKPHVESNKGDA